MSRKPSPAGGLSRRQMLTSGLGAAGAAALAAAAAAAQTPTPAPSAGAVAPTAGVQTEAMSTVPFYGAHQAGIATPVQARLVFAAFDFRGASTAELGTLLRTWTDAGAAICLGHPVAGAAEATLADTGAALAPPTDTGEAAGLGPANLSITVGFGPSLFDDRLGLQALRPAALIDIPKLPGDHLLPALSGGDLCVQACADDPQVAFHAVRNLARLGRGLAAIRWMQLGFGRTSTTSTQQATPRNLMGFKDGTNNLKIEQPGALDTHVWVGDESSEEHAWMRGGSYLISRRIRMRVESWDRASLDEQERTIGRRKTSGAPLTGEREFDTVNLNATAANDETVIDPKAHIRLASPDSNGGVHILRRGYSFTDGIDPTTGELDAGLFFICFQRDPRTGFVALQRRLATTDALNEYIRHTGSAIFACPPGVQAGGYLGSGLLG